MQVMEIASNHLHVFDELSMICILQLF